ncbi:MAG: uncharacterized protein H6Q89_1639 [Myxococcaceae bacterium]|nr:uncharacterized protein [Myxococcaceae bacterium]
MTLLALTLASLLGATDWPQSRGDAQNSAAISLDAPKCGKAKAWRFEGSGRVLGYEPGMTVWSSVALAQVDDRAVLAVGSYDHLVYLLDACSGQVQWKYPTGGAVAAAPTLWNDGQRVWLFAASSDRLVYALDASTGARLWSVAVEDYRPTLGGARLSSAVVGTVAGEPALFVGAWVYDRSLGASLQRGSVVALRIRDGHRLWTAALGDNEVAAPVLANVGGSARLFVASSDGTLHALDPSDGKTIWKRTELDAIRSPPAVVELPDGPVVVLASKYGLARALNAVDGAERWSVKTLDRVIGSPAIARLGDRWLVLVPSYDRHLWALDASTGAVVWRYAARAGVYSSPAIAADAKPPVAVVSAWDDALHVVDLATGHPVATVFTGRPLWDVAGLDSSTWSAPVVARLNGTWVTFAGSYDGVLRALPLEGAGAVAAGSDFSGLLFWLSFPATLVPLSLFAVWLTRRARRKAQIPSTSSGTARKGT